MELRTDITYKKDVIYMSLSMFFSFVFILFTNPNTISIVLLLLLPILVFISFYFISKLLLKLFSNFSQMKIKSLSIIIGFGPALVVVLGSLGSIGFQDVMLALLLVAGLSWYLKRFQLNGDMHRL